MPPPQQQQTETRWFVAAQPRRLANACARAIVRQDLNPAAERNWVVITLIGKPGRNAPARTPEMKSDAAYEPPENERFSLQRLQAAEKMGFMARLRLLNIDAQKNSPMKH